MQVTKKNDVETVEIKTRLEFQLNQYYRTFLARGPERVKKEGLGRGGKGHSVALKRLVVVFTEFMFCLHSHYKQISV